MTSLHPSGEQDGVSISTQGQRLSSKTNFGRRRIPDNAESSYQGENRVWVSIHAPTSCDNSYLWYGARSYNSQNFSMALSTMCTEEASPERSRNSADEALHLSQI